MKKITHTLLVFAIMLIASVIMVVPVFANETAVTTETELSDALLAGGRVVLGDDIVVNKMITIPNGVTVTLDLNGKTISQVKECTESYSMIQNNGNLTITGNGKISFTDTSVGASGREWGAYTIQNNGTLVVENGTIENLSQQNVVGQACAHVTFAIFQHNGSCTVYDGTISNENYRSVRLWSGEMVIEGGKFVGQIWVQCVDESAKLTINGGEFTNAWNDASSVFVENVDDNGNSHEVELAVTNGAFNGKIGCSNAQALAGSVTGGTFSATAASGTSSALLADGMEFVENADGTYGVYNAGLNGTGTEEDPYLINSLEDLIWFRDDVNNGNTYEKQYIKLTASISLTGINWTPIGNTKETSFKGNFDGGSYEITDLTVSGTDCLGLFGVLNTPGSINNVKVVNPTISGDSYLGAIVGHGYTGKINNCHVFGNISIVGHYMVGGITGAGYVTISNSSVVGNDISTSVITATHNGGSFEGDNVGGIIGHTDQAKAFVGFTVKNVTISGTRKVGGIVGITTMGSAFESCTVENVIVKTNATVDYANSNLKTMSIGGIAGQFMASGSNGSYTNISVSGLAFENENNVTVSAGVLAGGMRGTTVVLAPSAEITVSDVVIENVEGATVEYLVPQITLEDIFKFLGYSKSETGSSITAGFTIDHKALAMYKEQNGVSVDFGAVFAINSIADGSYEKSLSMYNATSNYNVILTNIDADNLDTTIVLSMYVKVGDEKYYVTESAVVTDNTQVAGTTYNTAPKKEEE